MRSPAILLLPLSLACSSDNIKGVTSGLGSNNNGQPNLLIEQPAINFDHLSYGSLGSEALIIRNVGAGTLVIETISLTTPFTTSSGGDLQVQPGTSTPITVQFIPTSYVDVEGTISLETNDPDEPQISLPIYGSVITDSDGDGFDSMDAGGDDCNDGDGDIYPGAEDEWYDGIDSNCAGDDDFDQDGDGYQTIVWNEDTTSGGDCQDANPAIYPGADDEWYDGIDSNCDGQDDYDQDGDGSRSEALGRGTDCDDFDASVNGAASESMNGQDDNCDGLNDNEVAGWNSDTVYYGTAANDKGGWHLTVGDIDQDGNDDLIAGSPGYNNSSGHIAVFSGDGLPVSGSDLTYAYNDFAGSNSSDEAGYYIGYLPNFLGDGEPSLAIGAPGYSNNLGRVYLLDGDEAFYGGSLDDSYLTITGTTTNYVGRGFSQDMDLNADGLDDLLGFYVSGSTQYIWLLYGGYASGDITINDVDARYTTGAGLTDETSGTSNSYNNMVRHFPNGGDVDGDGIDDAIYCSGLTDNSYGNTQGAVWMLWGGEDYQNDSAETFGTLQSSGSTYGTADVILTGSQPHHAGEACAIGPDWDGDGNAEVWAYYPGAQNSFTGLYVFSGGPDLRGSLYEILDGYYSYYFSTRSSSPVAGLRDAGDWDGDGVSEMAVSFGSSSSTDGGSAWLISSQSETGDHTDTDGIYNIEGDPDYNQVYYGNMIASRPGDLNNDGLMDWIASDWGYTGSGGASDATGAIYISYNLSQ
jgi:hypothetical protein